MNIREEMKLKGLMGHNAFMINEMAAKELILVIKAIKAGDIEKAAKEYVSAGGKPGGVTRTINHYVTNNPNQDNANFEKFKKHFADIKKAKVPAKDAEGKEIKRKYVKKTAEEGKQGQQAAKKRLEKKVVQQYTINKEFIDKIKAKSDEDLKKKAKEIVDDLTIGKTYEDDTAYVKTLKTYLDKGENKEAAVKAMLSVLKGGLISMRDFGLWAEKPEAFISSESKKRADVRREKIKDAEEEKK